MRTADVFFLLGLLLLFAVILAGVVLSYAGI
jgi:hypothetical protein